MKELRRLVVGLWILMGAALFAALVFADVKDPATIKTDATADLATNTEMFLQPTIDIIDSINIKYADHTAMEAGGTSMPNGTTVYLLGHGTTNDGGEGTFVLDTSAVDASAENDGTIFASAGGTDWYWRRTLVTNVTPEMFGAVADGTTDDSAKIQAAINTGKVIVLTSGKTYLVDAELTVTTDDTIIGNGGTLKTGPALAVTGGATNMFELDGDDNVTFDGIRFVGNGADPPLGPFDRYINTSTNACRALLIQNCIFEEAGVAIFFSAVSESSVVNNRFYNFTANQVYLRGGCVGNTISGNVFEDNGAQGANNHTIDIEANAGQVASTGNAISGNSVQSNGTPCQLTGTMVSDNTITGNTFINTSGDALNGNGLKINDCGRNTVTSNTISGPFYGVFEASEAGTVITNNMIIGRTGITLNTGSTTVAGPSVIIGNTIIADETGTHSGTAQAGTPDAAEITLQTTASSTNSAYNNKLVTITGGTGSGQTTAIITYTGASRIADVSPSFSPTPDATSTYDILNTTGTCQAGSTSSTIKLATTASATNGSYNLLRVIITGGTGTLGEFRNISSTIPYVGSTRVATVEPNWTVTPDGTTTYEVVTTTHGISVNTVGHTIHGNVIVDFHVDGINAEHANSHDMRITDNQFSGIGRYAFRIDQDDNYIAGNVTYDSIQTLRGAIVIGDNNVILDNEFFNNVGGSGAGSSRDFIHFDGGVLGNEIRVRKASFVQNVKDTTNMLVVNGGSGVALGRNIGRLTRVTTVEDHTLSLATTSDTTTISVPSGARLLGASFTVSTAVTDDGGNDTWSAAFITGSTLTLATDAAAAQNTKVNILLDYQTTTTVTTATTEIRFTPNGGSFSAGAIKAVVYYEELTSLAN